MRVRCLTVYPAEEQIALLGSGFTRKHEFPLTVGKEYLVLGLVFNCHRKGGGFVNIEARFDMHHVTWAPAILFEIVDDRVSHYWRAKAGESGTLALRPEEFHEPYFHDRLSDFEPEARELFHRVWNLLDREFQDVDVEAGETNYDDV